MHGRVHDQHGVGRPRGQALCEGVVLIQEHLPCHVALSLQGYSVAQQRTVPGHDVNDVGALAQLVEAAVEFIGLCENLLGTRQHQPDDERLMALKER